METGCHTETEREFPKAAVCPVNGRTYPRVHPRTVLHQLRQPWNRQLREQGYYFCNDPDCHVVYFGQDGMVILRDELRGPVGQKSRDEGRLVCYCFGISLADIAAAREPDGANRCTEFVVEQTRKSACACDVRNPSGKCCLKDFPTQ